MSGDRLLAGFHLDDIVCGGLALPGGDQPRVPLLRDPLPLRPPPALRAPRRPVGRRSPRPPPAPAAEEPRKTPRKQRSPHKSRPQSPHPRGSSRCRSSRCWRPARRRPRRRRGPPAHGPRPRRGTPHASCALPSRPSVVSHGQKRALNAVGTDERAVRDSSLTRYRKPATRFTEAKVALKCVRGPQFPRRHARLRACRWSTYFHYE